MRHCAECQMGVPFIDTESVGDLSAAVLPLDEERANVRLMAAAPDLLAACERVVERWETHDGQMNRIDDVLAAIAKAKGGAP